MSTKSRHTEKKSKTKTTAIDSAFIKINTIQHLIHIGMPQGLSKSIHPDTLLKVRLEVDKDPPCDTATCENKMLLLPIPFTVKTLRKEDLFAGKAHAALCRHWQGRVKGRDWYDLVWFISRRIPLNRYYLQKRMIQSGFWTSSSNLTHNELISIFEEKINTLDIKAAQADIINFVFDRSQLELWSKPFFLELVHKIQSF